MKNAPDSKTFPLRALAATLMLGLDPGTEMLPEDEIDMHEGAYRDPDSACHWDAYGIEVCNVSVEMESDRENAPRYTSYLFCRGQEVVIIDFDVPDYCDDESDAYIVNVSKLMSLAEARKTVNNALAGYRKKVEKHVAERGRELAFMLDGLEAEMSP